MKCEMDEYFNGFGLNLKPETIEEATLLVRLSINATQKVLSCHTVAREGKVSAWIEIGKLQHPSSIIQKKKR